MQTRGWLALLELRANWQDVYSTHVADSQCGPHLCAVPSPQECQRYCWKMQTRPPNRHWSLQRDCKAKCLPAFTLLMPASKRTKPLWFGKSGIAALCRPIIQSLGTFLHPTRESFNFTHRRVRVQALLPQP